MQSPNLEPPDEIPVIRPQLNRPAEPVGTMAPAPHAGVRIALVAGLMIAVAAAVVVIFVLPDLVAERAPPTPTPSSPVAGGGVPAVRDAIRTAPAEATQGATSRAPPAVDTRARDAAKRTAEAALADALRAKAVLESSEVALWAADAWIDALARLGEADASFSRGAFDDAAAAYRAVIDEFAEIDASRPERLAAALAAGAAALAAADGELAAAQFAIALALDPGNEVAAIGARRAQTIEQAMALITEGARLEADGELEAARERFAAAVALDEYLAAAGEGVERVAAAIVRRDFARAMTRALEALSAGQLGAAAEALRAAEALAPGTAEVRDARARLAAVSQLRRLEALRREADAQAGVERWAEAAAVYAKALAVDPGVAFAVSGKARAEAMVRLEAEIDGLIARPGRLADDVPLGRAREILADVAALSERGPGLERKVATLDGLVRAAGQPVSVLLLSDAATEVTLYRVGRLGAFDSRELRLRPGRYVAVGARAGYRDVRVEFEVTPGRAGAPVLVRCEERI